MLTNYLFIIIINYILLSFEKKIIVMFYICLFNMSMLSKLYSNDIYIYKLILLLYLL